jgi:hypothetical protein
MVRVGIMPYGQTGTNYWFMDMDCIKKPISQRLSGNCKGWSFLYFKFKDSEMVN